MDFLFQVLNFRENLIPKKTKLILRDLNGQAIMQLPLMEEMSLEGLIGLTTESAATSASIWYL